MRTLLLAAVWAHLVPSVLLVGGFVMLLLAGAPRDTAARRWDDGVVAVARVLVPITIGAGIFWLLVRTAVFENRAHAALEPRAIAHAMLDTWPGLVWLARHGLLIVLGAFLAMRADGSDRRNWIAVRAEAFGLATVALALTSLSSHAAAVTPRATAAVLVDAIHLVATGVWVGALGALALLLRAARRGDDPDAVSYAVRGAHRFSHAALVAMLLLIATGVMNARAQVETLPALMGTTHGRLLLAKLAVLVPILALAIVNRRRVLPALATPNALSRLAAFVTLEFVLALVLIAFAAGMTLTTPARHAEPLWPFSFRLSPEILTEIPGTRWRALLGSQLAVVGAVALLASLLVRRRRVPLVLVALVFVAVGAGVGLPPLVVDAYPTSYRRPPLTYHATSIAMGMAIYRQRCSECHDAARAAMTPASVSSTSATPVSQRIRAADGLAGARAAPDLLGARTSRRHAGELFWLVSQGIPPHGMPAFGNVLGEARRWDVINFIRAAAAAESAKSIGREIERDRARLIAPDFTIAVGPLAPGALRDYRGRRMVLLVLYTFPGSRARMAELARGYDVLSIIGVEVIGVPKHVSADPIGELGASPPVLFPVVTDGAAAIVATYGIFASGSHAELLIDRQGYVRAIWNDDTGRVQPEAEKLNEEKSPPPFPDDHVH